MENKKDILKEKNVPLLVTLKRTVGYAKKEIASFIIAFILIIANVLFALAFPLLVAKLTNELKLDADTISLQVIIIIAVSYLLLNIVSQVCLYFESMTLTKAGQKIIYNLRMEVFEHIESMSQNQFNEMAVGSLVTRVCNYTNHMSNFFTNTLVNILKNLLTVISVYVIMFFISWKLSLIMLIFVVIIFFTSYFFSKKINKTFKEERNALSDLNTYLNESLSGMKIIKIFNQENKSEKKFNEKNNYFYNIRVRATRAFSFYRPFISFLYIVSIGAVLYLGTIFDLNAGEIVAFYLYLSNFFNPVQELADKLNDIQRAVTSSEKLFALLDIPPEVINKEGAKDIDKFIGKIEFRHVWFAYEEENWILKDVSFVVNPKETVAFIGPTGAGKTTILGLIVRNFEIQKGQILIDDIDIKDITIESLRRSVGQMLQDVFLFSGTIKENITLFDDKYTDEEVYEAANYVNLTPIIDALPNKLNETVIERGDNFSAGQRQLLSFARTILHKPQIMILDEATANIDTETEVVIQESLEKIKNIGTMLIVAHRLSTIQHSDKIIVIKNGEVIESGNHQQLLKLKGYYYKLYRLQFNEQK
ncbi:MAG: ABC transporter ATP-binding protein [Bacilli bacterium]